MRLLVNFAFCFWLSGLASLAHADRIKDLASLAGVRNNQLVGYAGGISAKEKLLALENPNLKNDQLKLF